MIMGIVIEDERGAASGVSSAVWSLPNALSSFVGAYLMGVGLLAASFFLVRDILCGFDSAVLVFLPQNNSLKRRTMR